jgi:tetratricopeptide (TPR) repeat protein
VDDPEQRTRHLALASTAPDEATARELELAASAARARGAPEAAAELVELALQLTPVGSPTLTSLRFGLADHHYLAGDFQRAAQVLEELIETLPGGDLSARASLSLAEIEYWRGGESTAVRLTELALRDAADPLLRARLLASIAMHGATSDLPRAADAARASLEILEAQPNADPALVATSLSARVRADLFLGHGLDREGAERALELEAAAAPPVAVDARVSFKLGQWLRYVDDFAGARGYLEIAERSALDEGDESSLANILLNRTLLECWSGNWSIAAALGDQTHELFQLTGISVEASNVWRAYVKPAARGSRSGACCGSERSVLQSLRPVTLGRPRSTLPRRSRRWQRRGFASRRYGGSTATPSRLLSAPETSSAPKHWSRSSR